MQCSRRLEILSQSCSTLEGAYLQGTDYKISNAQGTWVYCHFFQTKFDVCNLQCMQCKTLQNNGYYNLVHSSAVKSHGAVCTRSKLSWRGAQQELTTATYLTAMKPPTVGHTTQHYPSKKTELGLLYSPAKNVPKRQSAGRYLGLKFGP